MIKSFFIMLSLLLSYRAYGGMSQLIDLKNHYKHHYDIPKDNSKKTIKVAVLDTNFDLTHPKYKDKLIVDEIYQKDKLHKHFTNIPKNIRPHYINKQDYISLDYYNHGTHVLGIISTIAKNIKILPLKVHHKEYEKEDLIINRTIEAIDFCIKEKVKIINYSTANGKNFSQKEKDALLRAKKAGIFIIVSSGNNNYNIDKNNEYPSKYNLENIFVIGGRNLESYEGNYSKNYVDTNLPSKEIFSTIPFDRFARMSGTSQATPFFTGLLSRVLSNGNLNFKAIRERIKNYTTKEDLWMDVNKFSGPLNITEFINGKKENKKQKVVKIKNNKKKKLKLKDLQIISIFPFKKIKKNISY